MVLCMCVLCIVVYVYGVMCGSIVEYICVVCVVLCV